MALHRSGRTRVAKPSGRCRGQPHIGHEPLHQTSSRAYPCRGGATQFHIGHRRAHQDKQFPLLDIGIAAAHITLAATAEGLGSCILGWFDEKAMRKLLHIPDKKRVILDIVVGYSTQPLREKNENLPTR